MVCIQSSRMARPARKLATSQNNGGACAVRLTGSDGGPWKFGASKVHNRSLCRLFGLEADTGMDGEKIRSSILAVAVPPHGSDTRRFATETPPVYRRTVRARSLDVSCIQRTR